MAPVLRSIWDAPNIETVLFERVFVQENLSFSANIELPYYSCENSKPLCIFCGNGGKNLVTANVKTKRIWAYGVVVSMFGFHRSDRGLNPSRGGKIS